VVVSVVVADVVIVVVVNVVVVVVIIIDVAFVVFLCVILILGRHGVTFSFCTLFLSVVYSD